MKRRIAIAASIIAVILAIAAVTAFVLSRGGQPARDTDPDRDVAVTCSGEGEGAAVNSLPRRSAFSNAPINGTVGSTQSSSPAANGSTGQEEGSTSVTTSTLEKPSESGPAGVVANASIRGNGQMSDSEKVALQSIFDHMLSPGGDMRDMSGIADVIPQRYDNSSNLLVAFKRGGSWKSGMSLASEYTNPSLEDVTIVSRSPEASVYDAIVAVDGRVLRMQTDVESNDAFTPMRLDVSVAAAPDGKLLSLSIKPIW